MKERLKRSPEKKSIKKKRMKIKEGYLGKKIKKSVYLDEIKSWIVSIKRKKG